MKRQKTKSEKGITLIALIITIVVLLILAVVAIREVQGDGIIAKAKEAKEKYGQSQKNEQVMLESYGNTLEYETNASIVPTEGTWYVSDECINFANGVANQLRTDLSWCEWGGEHPELYSYNIYSNKMNAVGTTKMVFSKNVNKLSYDFICNVVNLGYQINEIIFLADTVELPQYAYNCQRGELFIIPKNFKVLPIGFMISSTDLKAVQIPSTVTSIGESAFENIGVSLPEGTNVTFKVVQGSVADTWVQSQQATNPNWVIEYITE